MSSHPTDVRLIHDALRSGGKCPFCDHVAMTDPTTDQCTANASVKLPDGRTGYAIWYPQMGGYVSKAIVARDDGGCFDAWVWHDGEFPFDSDDPWRGQRARRLHHCAPEQFIAFGQTVQRLLDGGGQ